MAKKYSNLCDVIYEQLTKHQVRNRIAMHDTNLDFGFVGLLTVDYNIASDITSHVDYKTKFSYFNFNIPLKQGLTNWFIFRLYNCHFDRNWQYHMAI